jgi:hypothetical protein
MTGILPVMRSEPQCGPAPQPREKPSKTARKERSEIKRLKTTKIIKTYDCSSARNIPHFPRQRGNRQKEEYNSDFRYRESNPGLSGSLTAHLTVVMKAEYVNPYTIPDDLCDLLRELPSTAVFNYAPAFRFND